MSKLLTIQNLTKTFPGQVALDNVDLELSDGRTHALIGQNGSGKSTLIKILAGFHQADPGASADLAGKPFPLGDADAAKQFGIRFVHQDLGLVGPLSAVENIAMGVGYLRRRGGRVDWKANTDRARAALDSLGFPEVNVQLPVLALAPSERTAVALARALHDWENSAHLLVLDEPTAALPGADVERLFAAIQRLKDRGVAILYVSHHLDEVFEVADDVSVLRDGQRVATTETSAVDHDGLVELMVGHKVARDRLRVRRFESDDLALRVDGLSGGTLRNVDLQIQKGEIVGVAGIMGSGREVIAPFITGQIPSDSGEVWVGDTPIPNFAPDVGIKAGMATVSSDRANLGIIPLDSVRANVTLADVQRNSSGTRLDHKQEVAETQEWVEKLSVKTTGTEVPISSLSGGNQQKVLFARGLRLQPSLLVLDEPTSGIDVAAKEQIMELINDAANGGAGVLVVSTDTEELANLADRVVILVGGQIIDELSGDDMTVEHIERAQLQSAKAHTS